MEVQFRHFLTEFCREVVDLALAPPETACSRVWTVSSVPIEECAISPPFSSSSQQRIPKRGNKVTQAKPAPGNRSEVRTSQSECQKRNSTTCRSPTIDTSRKSSRTFGKKLNLAEVAPVIGIEALKTTY